MRSKGRLAGLGSALVKVPDMIAALVGIR